jgi:hypothetical protein
MIISKDAEKACDKIQQPFLMKLGIEGLYLNLRKVISDILIANMTLNVEELKPCLLKSGMRQGVYSLHSNSI